MGGTTITVYGNKEQEVLDKLREQIIRGVSLRVYPDSAAVLIRGDDLVGAEIKKKKAKLFNVELNEQELTVEFEEVERGRIFHVETAARYSKAPEPGQILGTVHLHT